MKVGEQLREIWRQARRGGQAREADVAAEAEAERKTLALPSILSPVQFPGRHLSQFPNDVFVLRWLGLGVDVDLASTMSAEQCEIIYLTCGTQSFGGLDRGRALSEMDEELMEMLQPFHTPKLNYAATPPAQMLTQVFWDEPGFAPVIIQRDRLSRTASVTVYSYQEQGE